MPSAGSLVRSPERTWVPTCCPPDPDVPVQQALVPAAFQHPVQGSTGEGRMKKLTSHYEEII